MTHWRAMIEKDHLGAWDLVDDAGNPRDYTLKIAKVESVALKTRETPKGKRKCVITFERARKKMVCNTTNCEILENLYGPQIEGWIGKLITIYQGDVRSPKGGTTKGIKVRPKVPTGRVDEVKERAVDEALSKEHAEAFDGEGGEGAEGGKT